MKDYRQHLISKKHTIKEALKIFDVLAKNAIVFIVDEGNILVGSLTDGDVRRGLLKGVNIGDSVATIMQSNPKYIHKNNYSIQKVISYRENNYRLIPVLDKFNRLIDIINFDNTYSYLPVDAVIMAGGLGSRLKPLTDIVPKPLLKVGEKPIIDYNIDRLSKFGITNFWLTLGYLGEQLEAHYGNGKDRNVRMKYIWEKKPLGTIGAVSKITDFKQDYVLVMNSDILTNLDFEDFFEDFINEDADMSVVTVPYHVDIPYAIMETNDNRVISFKEKPTYTYYSNGGIYLIKRHILDKIPRSTFYDSTDLMQVLIKEGGKLISYPTRQYWLDIGSHDDFNKAQEDVKHITL